MATKKNAKKTTKAKTTVKSPKRGAPRVARANKAVAKKRTAK